MLLLLFISLCVVSAYDIFKRCIPNWILLVLFLIKILGVIIEFSIISLIDSFLGLVLAVITFIIPKIFKMSIGWGDVKFAAVLGLWLGVVNFIYGMLISVFSALIYLILRKFISKKDIKNYPLPLGLVMSFGAIFICILEIIL